MEFFQDRSLLTIVPLAMSGIIVVDRYSAVRPIFLNDDHRGGGDYRIWKMWRRGKGRQMDRFFRWKSHNRAQEDVSNRSSSREWKIYNFDQQADRGFSPRAENNNAPGYKGIGNEWTERMEDEIMRVSVGEVGLTELSQVERVPRNCNSISSIGSPWTRARLYTSLNRFPRLKRQRYV